MHSTLLLVIVVATALAFDVTNGFHDTANVVAPAISTQALSPRTAFGLAASLNFVGALLSLKVAATIATGIISAGQVTEPVAFAALAGAIVWNLTTWAFGLPSSSSHALIGALIGALLAEVGSGAVRWHGLLVKVVLPGLLSPLVAFGAAGLVIIVLYRLLARRRPGPVNRTFRFGEVISSAALALAHGSNDAQKTMGIIGLALLAHGAGGAGAHFHVPLWVVLSAASAMAVGTYVGGWRIIRTVGTRIIRMDTAQGFVSQASGAVVILLSSHLGYPLSSTQVISGGVMGAGAGKRLSAVRWGVAGNIVGAWVLTLPFSALLGACALWLTRAFGDPVLGAIVIVAAVAGIIASVAGVQSRVRARQDLAAQATG